MIFNFFKKESKPQEENIINESYDYSDASSKEEQFYRDLESLRLKYQMGKIPKLNNVERQILEFCDSRDMRQFLKEEFEKHPIKLDENGCLIGENPFNNNNQHSYFTTSISNQAETPPSNEDLGIY